MQLKMQSFLTAPIPFPSLTTTRCKRASTDEEESFESYGMADGSIGANSLPPMDEPKPPERPAELLDLEKQGLSVSSDADA